MKILVIIAHPDIHSFNYAIANKVINVLHNNHHDIIYHDLYKENFSPVLPAIEIPQDTQIPSIINEHCGDISTVEGIIVVHPNWWGQPPAILKGWIDRVIRPGIAYEFDENDKGEGIPKGLLKAKTAVVFNTSNTSVERELAVFGDPLELIWKNCIFGLCGINNFYRKNFQIIVTSTPEQRMKWLEEVIVITNRFFPPGPKSI